MQAYTDIIAKILTNGVVKEDRTGTGTVSYFGIQQRFNLQEGFPLLSLKETKLKPIVAELLWFIEGSTNNNRLKEMGAGIWNQWASADGDLGPIYGAQWNNWQTPALVDERPLWKRLMSAFKGEATPPISINQLQYVIDLLRTNPKSRRMLVTGWNPGALPVEGLSHAANVACGRQVLPPCHTIFQFEAAPLRWEDRLRYLIEHKRIVLDFDAAVNAMNVALKNETEETVDAARHVWLDYFFGANEERGWDELKQYKYRLSCQLYTRSQDVLIGTPFNIASYSLLTMMVAQCVGMLPGDFIWSAGDAHIYLNHLEAAQELLNRTPYVLPTLRLNPEVTDLWKFKADDIELVNYVSHPAIKLSVAV